MVKPRWWVFRITRHLAFLKIRKFVFLWRSLNANGIPATHFLYRDCLNYKFDDICAKIEPVFTGKKEQSFYQG